MSKSNAFENEWLLLMFNNIDITGVGDAGGLRGSVVAGNLYVSLHTGDPGEVGTQATNECAYGSYARVGVARSNVGWTVTNNEVRNAAEVLFPTCTSGSESVTHFVVGKAASGAQTVLYYGALNSPFAVSATISPKFNASAMLIAEN